MAKKVTQLKSIAKVVDRTPAYVRSVLRGNGIKYRESNYGQDIIRKCYCGSCSNQLCLLLLQIQASKSTVPELGEFNSRVKAESKNKKAGLNVGTVTSTTSTINQKR
jgi:eukaryotic-like serine/threonine-protein kinase